MPKSKVGQASEKEKKARAGACVHAYLRKLANAAAVVGHQLGRATSLYLRASDDKARQALVRLGWLLAMGRQTPEEAQDRIDALGSANPAAEYARGGRAFGKMLRAGEFSDDVVEALERLRQLVPVAGNVLDGHTRDRMRTDSGMAAAAKVAHEWGWATNVLRAAAEGRRRDQNPPTAVPPERMREFRKRFEELEAEPDHKKRGRMFEPFLNDFFDAHGLAARGSFQVKGSQIDGSFEWHGDTYKVEARWRKKKANAADLQVLRGKAEISGWTKGLFISMSGFSLLASETHRMSRTVNLIGMSGEDLTLILEGRCTLDNALRAKRRHAAETGEAYLPLAKAKRRFCDGRT